MLEVSPKASFWRKPTSLPESSSAISYSGFLYAAKTANFLVPRLCFLAGSHLYEVVACWNAKAVCLEADLEFVSIRPFCDAGQRFGFTVVRKYEELDFFTATEADLDQWLQRLELVAMRSELDDDYATIRSLGEGGQSTVFLAESKLSGEKVAVKRYAKRELGRSLKKLQSLRSEISILRSLSHPAIIKLRAVYESEEFIDLILDYYEGVSLSESLKNPFSQSEATKFMRVLLEALLYLSERNIMHRDLKPENIILTDETDRSSLRLIDFGLAKQVIGEEIIDWSGSPGYMAPEILLKRKHSLKADIYSAGVLFYTLITGRNPFVGATRDETLRRNCANVILFDEEWAEINPKLTSMIRVMTSLSPDARMDVRALLAWLQRQDVRQAARSRSGTISHCADSSAIERTLQAARDLRDRRSSFRYVLPPARKA